MAGFVYATISGTLPPDTYAVSFFVWEEEEKN